MSYARLILAQIENSVELPTVFRRSSQTLILHLGDSFLGWEFAGKRRERPGLPLDLSSAVSVALHVRQLIGMPSLIESEHVPTFADLEISGVIDADRLSGKVAFALSHLHMDRVGRFLLLPIITALDGSERVPRTLKLQVV